jgi:glycosyltransferase involved in cell wall biosynthesis
MRVRHLYAGNLYGGIETILVTLARRASLVPEMTPCYALCFEGRLSRELQQLGATVDQLGEVKLSRPWTGMRARRKLREVIAARKIDVVVCHAPWNWAVFGGLLTSMSVPTVLWLHNRMDGPRDRIERLAMRHRPDRIISVSGDTAKTVQPLFLDVPIEVIYCPLDDQHVASPGDRNAVRESLGTPAEKVVILQVSRMEEWKGRRTHIQALARLKDLPNWECWMAGGAQRPHEVEHARQMKELACVSGIEDRVRFLGERSDVRKLMCAADIFCQPNLGPEGLGIVFLEAFMSRLPTVTTNIGGAPEIVDDSCGAVVAVNDPSALADALRKLIENPSLRRELGSAGPAKVRSMCDPKAQIERLHRFLVNAAENKNTVAVA